MVTTRRQTQVAEDQRSQGREEEGLKCGPHPIKALPTVERLRFLFDYHPSGKLLYSSGCPMFGCVVGHYAERGYGTVRVDGRVFMVHRLIWKLLNGCDPEGMIDHINGDRWDNRIENLRDVSPALNAKNREDGRWLRFREVRRQAKLAKEQQEKREMAVWREEAGRRRYLALKAKYEPDEQEKAPANRG